MTDAEGTALQVNPRNPNAWNEISDGTAQSYSYRYFGYIVQSYWSQADRAYVIPTAQTENFYVDNAGTQLTVNGDQRANHSDLLEVDDVNNRTQIRAAINGELVQFEPNVIRSVIVNSGDGGDTINVYNCQLNINVPISITSSGPATVNIGNSANGVQGISSTISVANPPSFSTLNSYLGGVLLEHTSCQFRAAATELNRQRGPPI